MTTEVGTYVFAVHIEEDYVLTAQTYIHPCVSQIRFGEEDS